MGLRSFRIGLRRPAILLGGSRGFPPEAGYDNKPVEARRRQRPGVWEGSRRAPMAKISP